MLPCRPRLAGESLSYSVKFGLLPATSLPSANLHKNTRIKPHLRKTNPGFQRAAALWQGGKERVGLREGEGTPL